MDVGDGGRDGELRATAGRTHALVRAAYVTAVVAVALIVLLRQSGAERHAEENREAAEHVITLARQQVRAVAVARDLLELGDQTERPDLAPLWERVAGEMEPLAEGAREIREDLELRAEDIAEERDARPQFQAAEQHRAGAMQLVDELLAGHEAGAARPTLEACAAAASQHLDAYATGLDATMTTLGTDIAVDIEEATEAGRTTGYVVIGALALLSILLVEPALRRSARAQRALSAQTRELARARAAAEEAAQAKTRFLSAVSHEIRTPLNGIIGFAELLGGSDDIAPAQRAEWTRAIRTSGMHLLALINDVLDIAKHDAGAMRVDLQPCRPRHVIEGAVAILGAHARERGIELSVECAPDVPAAILSDATRLRQIVTNLVGNALKFTPSGGVHVFVSARTDVPVPRLRIDVRDTGIGMTPEQVAGLFAPFHQAHWRSADRFGGTGLGLAISQRIAHDLGGEIRVQSSPGMGSTFTVEVEARAAELPEPEAPAAPPLSRACPESPAEPLAGRRVLVVDDVETNRQVCAAVLRRAGAEVTCLGDGREAVKACRGADFDLVLMDLQMPVLNGADAARAIRGFGVATPILGFTAGNAPTEIAACRDAGMEDVVHKPIRPADLVAAACRWIGSAPRRDPAPAARAEEPAQEPADAAVPAGDDAFARRFAADWLARLPSRLDEAESAWAAGDVAAVSGLGHTLAGSGGTLGMPQFTAAGVRLSEAALRGDPDAVAAALAHVRALHEDALECHRTPADRQDAVAAPRAH